MFWPINTRKPRNQLSPAGKNEIHRPLPHRWICNRTDYGGEAVKRKLLTRREAALVRHAKAKAVMDYKRKTRIEIIDCKTVHDSTLEELELANALTCTGG